MATNSIDIKVTATDLASKTLDKIGKETKELGDESKTASTKVDKLGKTTEEAGKKAKKSGTQFGGLKTAVVGFLSIKTVQAMANLAKEAAKFEEVSFGFKRNFGDMEESLNDLRTASRGTISDFNLMLASNKAALLGVTSNSAELSAVMQTAIIRGKELGISTTQAFDDIVTGIGRGSPLILDNLGILIPTAFKKSISAMSDAKKTQALLNLVIKDGAALQKQYGNRTETSADKMARMGVKVANLKNKIGGLLIPVFEGLIDSISELENRLSELIRGINAITGEKETGFFADVQKVFGGGTVATAERRKADADLKRQRESEIRQANDRIKRQGLGKEFKQSGLSARAFISQRGGTLDAGQFRAGKGVKAGKAVANAEQKRKNRERKDARDFIRGKKKGKGFKKAQAGQGAVNFAEGLGFKSDATRKQDAINITINANTNASPSDMATALLQRLALQR